MKKLLVKTLLLMMSTSLGAQMMRDDIGLSDPFVLADPVSKAYYMTGTAGDVFKSTDLEVWTKLPWVINTTGIDWIGANHTVPSPGLIWAPELYYKDGAYYDVVTFTNPNSKTEGTNFVRRSIHILKSNKPQGPFSKITGGDDIYLPASKMALDGSIWEEDGRLYLVYCYEWMQAGDGAIEYIELKSDLTGTIGTEITICRASNGRAWNTDAVTDGPFLFRTQTGRLGMIWTSWRSGVYVQGVSYSDNGKLNGNWTHSTTPVTPDNHGHGMLFRTFDGQLLMSIHSNRNIDLNKQQFERHPALFIVDDSGDELQVVMQYRHKYSLTSPSEVVVLNPNFDYSTSKWTCTTDAVNKGIASNQNGAITGKFYESWDSRSFIGEISQQLKVPNGIYRFTAAAFRSALISGASDDNSAVRLFANENECDITSATPNNYAVTVHVTNGTLRFGIRSTKTKYMWMGIDNVRIKYYGTEPVTEEQIKNVENGGDAIYLMNSLTQKYLNSGLSWGTQAVLNLHPLDLYFVELINGKHLIDTRIGNDGGNHYAGTNGYMDSQMAPFYIDMKDSVTCTLSTNGTHYWGAITGSDVIQTNLTSSASKAAQWVIKKRSDLLADFSQATFQAPVDATFLVKGANFGRNDTRIGANWSGTYQLGGLVTNQCAQAPSNAYNISQTITGIPNGVYELRAQGFYRHGTATVSADYRSRSTEQLLSYLYANNETTPIKSIFDHANNSAIPIQTSDNTTLGNIPATLEAASSAFTAGLYTNKLLVEVTDGILKLGIKKNTGDIPVGNWTVFDNFELYYLDSETLSGIENISTSQPVIRKGIYDLNGRKVSDSETNPHSLKRGIYIVNGQKKMLSGDN